MYIVQTKELQIKAWVARAMSVALCVLLSFGLVYVQPASAQAECNPPSDNLLGKYLSDRLPGQTNPEYLVVGTKRNSSQQISAHYVNNFRGDSMANFNNHGKKKVAILIENGVEDSEFQVPYNGLKQAGIEVVVLGGRMDQKYKGREGKVSLEADGTTTEAIANEFDAVVIPGGMAPDKMRRNPNTVRFVQQAMQQGKLIAAVCHGPQVLIEGDLLEGKQATGFSAIRKDMINAGAKYVDEPLVVDGNLITSRQPGDLAIFTTAILSRLGYGGKDAALPDENDTSAEWWKLGDAWGGSTKGDIVKGVNTALAGERYSLEALEKYSEKESDAQVKALFQEIITNKQRHILKLESYLDRLGEKPSLAANIANQYAKVKTAMTGSDDIFQLRSALGDVQTGIGDIGSLIAKYTDPVATALFRDIYNDLLSSEQRLVQLYQQRMGLDVKPTTAAAV